MALVVVIRYFRGVHTLIHSFFVQGACGVAFEKIQKVFHLLRSNHPFGDDDLAFREVLLRFRKAPGNLEPKFLPCSALFSDDPGKRDWALSIEISYSFDY